MAVLVTLCDSQCRVCCATLKRYDQAITDIVVCLYPSQDSAKNTESAECSVLTRMMSFVVEQCQPWHTNAVNTVFKFHQAKLILNSLQNALNRSGLAAYIIHFIQLGYVPEWWDSEIAFTSSFQVDEAGNCTGKEVCSGALDRLRLELAIDFSSLLLTAAWQSNRSPQSPGTCQRLLKRLKRSSSGQSNLFHCHTTGQIMGLQDAGVLNEAQIECKELRGQLHSSKAQRIVVEAQLTQSKKLLEEEQQASHAIQQYLEAAERECSEMTKALRAARDDYKELLQEADRRIRSLEDDFREKEVAFRADFCARETDLKDEADDVHCKLKRKDQELQREKEDRANLATEMEAALAHSNAQVGKDIFRI